MELIPNVEVYVGLDAVHMHVATLMTKQVGLIPHLHAYQFEV